MGIGEVGGQGNGLAVTGNGILQAAQCLHGVGQIDVGLGEIRVECQGALVAIGGVFEPSQPV